MLRSFFLTAWRSIVKHKLNAIFNITGLSIGIAVCLLIGVWLRHELTFDAFHTGSIYRLYNTFKSESESFSQAGSGVALGAHLPDEVSSITAACRVFNNSYRFRAGEVQFFEDRALNVDANFFTFFNFELKVGNASDVFSSPDKVVLTEASALRYFGTLENIHGKQILMDEQLMTVGGIAANCPVRSHIQFDILVPYSNLRNYGLTHWQADLDSMWLGGWPLTYVRIANDERWKETEQQINEVVKKYSEADWKDNKFSYAYFLQPIEDIHLKSKLRYDAANNGSLASVRIFAAVGLVVLLLACINYINLSTAGAALRAKETSVKKVVGASRQQLVRQFFFETFITCSLSVGIGVGIFYLALEPMSGWIGQTLEFAFDITTLALIFGFVIVITGISGFYPAAVLSSFNPAQTLKGSFLRTPGGQLLRKGLVVFQFTVTIALIASIIVIQRQMNFIQNASLGFKGDAVIAVDFNGDAEVRKAYNSIRNELLSNAAIRNVSKHNGTVVGGLGNGWTTTTNLKGEEISTSLYRIHVDADYYDTYGLELAAGRFPIKDSPADSAGAVLVNEAAVRTFGWQTPENALGKEFGKGDRVRRVVGVVKDFNFENLHKPVEALMIENSTEGGMLSLKAHGEKVLEAVAHLEVTWKKLAPGVPLRYSFIDESVARQYGSERKMSLLFYGFSGLSLLIACLGLFGLAMFIVQQRTKEIGIRKVLGANVTGIVAMLTGEFTRLIFVAALIATPIAWYMMDAWLADFAFRTDIGWWVFVVAGIGALTIALITVGLQALRAAMVNPVNSLRVE